MRNRLNDEHGFQSCLMLWRSVHDMDISEINKIIGGLMLRYLLFRLLVFELKKIDSNRFFLDMTLI